MHNNNSVKAGAIIIVIGRMGSGKSPYIKDLMKNSTIENKVVYDRRKEYDAKDFTLFYELKYFRKKLTDITDSWIVIEEATGFVAFFKDMELSDLIIGIQHNRNILVMMFHSITDAPDYILRLSDLVVLFATGDDEKKVESQRSKLFPFYKKEKKKNADGWNIPEVIEYNKL